MRCSKLRRRDNKLDEPRELVSHEAFVIQSCRYRGRRNLTVMTLITIDNALSGDDLLADMILLALAREELPEHHEALREYVRWLLVKLGHQTELKDFDERLKASDASLDAQVAAGEITESQAKQTKGDRVWWRALEETRGASGYLALAKILEHDLTAHFNGEPVNPGEGFEEMKREFEHELAAKLRELLHVNEA